MRTDRNYEDTPNSNAHPWNQPPYPYDPAFNLSQYVTEKAGDFVGGYDLGSFLGDDLHFS